MSALVTPHLAVNWCVAVRGTGVLPVVHLVGRTTAPPYGPIHDSPALCRVRPENDRFGRPHWSRVRRPGKTHCQKCFALACDPSLSVRVDWG